MIDLAGIWIIVGACWVIMIAGAVGLVCGAGYLARKAREEVNYRKAVRRAQRREKENAELRAAAAAEGVRD